MNTSTLLEYCRTEAARIDSAMREDLSEALEGCDQLLTEALEYSLFNGGKRIRPLLVLLASQLETSEQPPGFPGAAIAFEYLHAATLIHDDIIDRAHERRGRASLARAFSTGVAILTGDWLHARAMLLIGRFCGAEGLTIFCRATLGMVDGEFLQFRHRRNYETQKQDYMSVIHSKTALLIGAASEIGGLSAGMDEQQRKALRSYGLNLGAAFQMVDDLLDYLGDPKKTGKCTGNDLAEGKITLPLLHALEQANKEERRILLDGIESTPGPETLEKVKKIIAQYRGFDYTRERASELIRQGQDALDIFRSSGNRNTLAVLESLGEYVLSRNH